MTTFLGILGIALLIGMILFVLLWDFDIDEKTSEDESEDENMTPFVYNGHRLTKEEYDELF